MKRYKDLLRLKDITEASFVAAQGKMRRLQAEEADLREQLSALQDRGRLSNHARFQVQQAGADVRWQRWVDQRREQINGELARLYVQKEDIRRVLRVAFGKDQALKHLLNVEKQTALKKRNRHVS